MHVHDLVDNVTQESELAGRNAAYYVFDQIKRDTQGIKLINGRGVAYVVPQIIHPENMEEQITLYLRVKDVYKNARLNASMGNQVLQSSKKLIMVPGEMQTITLKKSEFIKDEDCHLMIEVAEGEQK